MGAEVSMYPFAVAIGAAMVGFAMLVPWLVHESRRPLHVRAEHGVHHHEPATHPRVSAFVLCARSIAVSLSPKHVHPDPTEAAKCWRGMFADALHPVDTATARYVRHREDDVAVSLERAV